MRWGALSIVAIAVVVVLIGIPAGWYSGASAWTVCEARFGHTAAGSGRPGKRCPDELVRGALKVAAQFQSVVRNADGDVCALLPANFQSSFYAAARQDAVSCRVEALRQSGVTVAQALQPISSVVIFHSSHGYGAILGVSPYHPGAPLPFDLTIDRPPGRGWHLNQIGYQP
jgi:hypothetical protein